MAPAPRDLKLMKNKEQGITKVEVLSGLNKYLEITLGSFPYNAFPSQFFIPCFTSLDPSALVRVTAVVMI